MAVVPFPNRPAALRVDPARLLPSGRAVLAAFALVGAAVALYAGARTTKAFAIRTIEVQGAPGPTAARVRAALRPLVGTSLVGLAPMEIARRVDALPEVASSRSDRAFPHTLRVWIVRERPVAVARRGAESWLVSARGRVVARLRRGGRPALPRIWLTRRTDVALGAHLADPDALASVRAAAMLERTGFPVRVASVDATGGQLLFQLRSGIELRLGAPSDLELKLVIARQIVGGIAAPGYLDVSVPERPTAGPRLSTRT